MTQSINGVWRRNLISLVIGSAAMALAIAATAQQPETNGKKPAPPALSNLHTRSQVKGAGSYVESDLVSEQDRSDAIAAETLGEIYEQANNTYLHHGEFNHIINLNQVVMEGDPTNVETYSNNAYLLWSTSRNDQAVAALKKGVAANPDEFYMYDELGQYYWLHFKDYKNAIPYLEKATKFECPLKTWHSLALCYEKSGQWDKAVQAWGTACKNPDDKIAFVHLKRAQAEVDKRKGKG